MLDDFDKQAIAEAQALSDARKVMGRNRRSRNSRYKYRYRTELLDVLKSDKGWNAKIRRLAVEVR